MRYANHPISLLFVCSVLILAPTTTGAAEQDIPAIASLPQSADWWNARHADVLLRLQQEHVNLLMIGDSITQGWNGDGQRVWAAYYGHRQAVNLGFSGDRTEQVLWRLQHGEIDGISPKVAVVMIGTNNSGARMDPPEQTAAGIHAILTVLRANLPETRVLLLGIFPRGATATDPLRQLNGAINVRLRQFAATQCVFYLDIGDLFVDAEGQLKSDLMPDLLHVSERGYRVWAEGMEDRLKVLLGE
ncbi:MAG TPA: GDSL-type esterase/lipase family protein [Nitrospira sp.]|nr:GDSL-type esterase/lipase family protein [Nitrospira sp.]